MAYEDSTHGGNSSYESPDTLLAGLARDAHVWAAALDSARHQLPVHLAQLGAETVAVAVPAGDIIAEMLTTAHGEVMLVDPGGHADWRWPNDLATHMSAAAGRGCHVRVLLGRPVEQDARHVAECVDATGSEIRLGKTPDRAILTTDRATVLPAQADAPVATAVTQPQLVHLLRGFAEMAWLGAAPMRSHATSIPAGPGPDRAHLQLHHRILRLMASGTKDEAIARLLGMSVRTCRRHIADIMDKLDAVSRFQAGANAVQFGLAGMDVSVAEPWSATSMLRSFGDQM